MHGLPLGNFLLTSLVAGILGAGAMEATMWAVAHFGWGQGNMIVALGSLVTRTRDRAVPAGVTVHVFAAIFFSAAYVAIFRQVGITGLPGVLVLGLGIGFLHGMVVSLLLVWVVAEHHPLAEFRDADLAIGLSHLAGHLAFGGMVGMVAAMTLP